MKTKIKTHASDSSNQYSSADRGLTIVSTTAAWKSEHDIPKAYGTSLFYGSAYHPIPRKFAADILRQFRRYAKLKGNSK